MRLQRAREAIEVSRDQSLAQFLALATVAAGWAAAQVESPESGVQEILEGLGAWEVTGSRLVLPLYGALLAEALVRAGRSGEAIRTLTNALRTARTTGERFYEAELYRLRADLRHQADDRTGAEKDLLRAIRVSQLQRARSLELRARVSLYRLMLSLESTDGSTERALTSLTACFGSFDEGFGANDLQEAAALLGPAMDIQSRPAPK